MSQSDKKKNKESGERGSQDELEILKIILDNNPHLKKRVLQKLREHRMFMKLDQKKEGA